MPTLYEILNPGTPSIKKGFANLDDYNSADWKRETGTRKGFGYFGLLENPNGGVSSEVTIGVPIGGKIIDVPSLVPGLTAEEINAVLNSKGRDLFSHPLYPSIERKATDHALKRLAIGKSIFADSQNDQVGLPFNLRDYLK